MDPKIQLTYTKHERALVTWSAMLGFGFDFYNLIVLAFLVKPIQDSLKISLASYGLIVSATLGASVLGGVLFGWIGDKIGRKNALFGSLFLLAVGGMLSAVSWNFGSMLVFRILTGIGVGGEWGAGMVLLNEVWPSHRRGIGSGLVQCMSWVGLAFSVVVATVLLANFHAGTAWRVALLISGVPLILLLFVRRNMPESRLWLEYDHLRKTGELPPEKLKSMPLVELFRGRALTFFVVGVLMCGGYIFNYQSISIYMPTLMLRMGTSLAALRSINLLVAPVAVVGMVGTGYVSDRWGRRWSVLSSTLIGIIGLLFMYMSGAERYPGSYFGWPLFWAYLVWGFGQGAIGQFGPWYAELYPVEMRNTAASTIFTAGRLVGATAPYVIPLVAAATGNLRNAMMLAIPASVISLLCALLLPETAGRSFAVVERIGMTNASAAGK